MNTSQTPAIYINMHKCNMHAPQTTESFSETKQTDKQMISFQTFFCIRLASSLHNTKRVHQTTNVLPYHLKAVDGKKQTSIDMLSKIVSLPQMIQTTHKLQATDDIIVSFFFSSSSSSSSSSSFCYVLLHSSVMTRH